MKLRAAARRSSAQTAAAFGAVPGTGLDQCRVVARVKLEEAKRAVVSAIFKA